MKRRLAARLGGGLLATAILAAGLLVYRHSIAATTPTITSTIPSSGLTSGGQNVTISGQNFDQFGNQSGPTLTNTWTNLGTDLPIGLRYSQAAVIGSKIYLFGGYTTAPVNAIYSASTSTPTTWTTETNVLPSATTDASLVVIGQDMYLFGGGAGYNAISHATTSSPTVWTDTGATLPRTVGFASPIVLNGYIYLFGGSTSDDSILRAPVSNPTDWSVVGNIGAAIYGSSYAVVGGYIYMFGGYTTSILNIIWRAPVSNPTSWSNTGSTLPGAFYTGNVLIAGGYIYLVDGYNAGTTAIYRAALSTPTTWASSGTFPVTGFGSQLVIAGGYVYVLGGNVAGNSVRSVYRATLSATGTDYYNLPWLSDLPKPVTGANFGGIAATNVEYFPGGTTLVATTPSHAAGSVDVSATDGTTTATLTNGYAYTPPTLTYTNLKQSIADTQGGKLVTLHNITLDTGYTLSLGGTSCATAATTQDSITCFVPDANTIVPIVIRDSEGDVIWTSG